MRPMAGIDPETGRPLDPEQERIEKLEEYWRYFKVEQRYGLSFKDFVRKVDNGTWTPYLAG